MIDYCGYLFTKTQLYLKAMSLTEKSFDYIKPNSKKVDFELGFFYFEGSAS
jgi:hypothetical protein